MLFGWRHHHASREGITPDGYADGFPTEVLLRDGTLVFLPIAGARGALTPAQTHWVEDLRAVRNVDVHIADRGAPDAIVRALRPTGESEGR